MSTAQQELSIVGQDTAVGQPRVDGHPKQAPSDLRHFSMMMPVEEQRLALAEFKERRDSFRDWLRSQLVEGIHYGYPPGCEPRFDDHGNVLIWMKGGYKPYPKEQWTPKPSFYLAGADFVCDLLGLKPEYAADKAAWEQMGSPVNTFVFACHLRSRANGEIVGEGRGVRQVGQKGGDANNAIKMAMKSAKVAAVLDTYGLRDAFTQDLEDAPRAAADVENPDHDASTPRVQPRAARFDAKTIGAEAARWKASQHPDDATPEGWVEWVRKTTNCNFDPTKASQWTAAHLMLVRQALDREEGK